MRWIAILVLAMVLGITSIVSANVTTGAFTDNFDDGNADGWLLAPNRYDQYGNWSVENGSLLQNTPGDGYIILVR